MAALVAYFSRKGENYWDGEIKDLEKGNTEVAAEFVRKAVHGDLFAIKTFEPYPEDYYECTDVARTQLEAQERPPLRDYGDIDGYDTVFLGYPNWWGTCPMPVFSFLEHHEWAGKRIIPFCTSEGSGLGSSEYDIKKACPDATVEDGLAIPGKRAEKSEVKIESWAKGFVS